MNPASVDHSRLHLKNMMLESWIVVEAETSLSFFICPTDTSETRLYVIRNEEPGEACLNQVKAKWVVLSHYLQLGHVDLSMLM